MSQLKVVLLEDRYANHDHERKVLEAIGARVVEGGHAQTAGAIIALCKDADGITVNLARLTAEVIAGLERCKVIARYGVGYDNVDVAAASRKGIQVVNVPDYCFEDVSDQAMALWLACVRKTALRDRQVRAGRWDIGRQDPIGRIAGKVFGLAGYGGIARTLHRKLLGFNLARVLVFDPFVPAETVRAAGAEPVDFATLLTESDYISCHVPLNPDTRHLFNRDAFARMKPTALFINTSRGGLVDTAALHEALQHKRLAGAGLDVHEQEPVPKDYILFELDNVVLSDHTGWYSEESQIELQTKAAQGVADVLTGKTPHSVVNRANLGHNSGMGEAK
jgi:D-3-phosphoglycerate dehydrogenase